MKDWTIIGLGVVSAVIAALAVEWLNRTFGSPTQTANDSAWNQRVGNPLANLNLAPESPASAYQAGAPVTNYREYQRIGVMEVPVS